MEKAGSIVNTYQATMSVRASLVPSQSEIATTLFSDSVYEPLKDIKAQQAETELLQCRTPPPYTPQSFSTADAVLEINKFFIVPLLGNLFVLFRVLKPASIIEQVNQSKVCTNRKR